MATGKEGKCWDQRMNQAHTENLPFELDRISG